MCTFFTDLIDGVSDPKEMANECWRFYGRDDIARLRESLRHEIDCLIEKRDNYNKCKEFYSVVKISTAMFNFSAEEYIKNESKEDLMQKTISLIKQIEVLKKVNSYK